MEGINEHRRATRCHLQSPTPFSWDCQNYPVAADTSIEDDHTNRRLCNSPYHEGIRFFSASTIPVGLFRQTGHHFSVRHVVAARYRRSTRCSRLIVWPSDYCIQAHRDQNWNRQHWSRVIFVDESRFGHYLCDGRKRVSGRLANCCIEQTDRLCSPSFVAWGTFHFHVTGTSDLVVVDDQVNQKCYNNILDQNVFPRGLGIFSKKLCACASQTPPHPHTHTHTHTPWNTYMCSGKGRGWGHSVVCREPQACLETRWDPKVYLRPDEVIITLRPQWRSYESLAATMGNGDPLYGWRSLCRACLDNWGTWWLLDGIIADINLKSWH